MPRSLTVMLVALLGAFLGLACGSSGSNTLEARFAREEKCEGSVYVRFSGERHYVAEGCGKRAEYVCSGAPPTNARQQCQRAGLPAPPGSSVGPARDFPVRPVDDQPGRPPGE